MNRPSAAAWPPCAATPPVASPHDAPPADPGVLDDEEPTPTGVALDGDPLLPRLRGRLLDSLVHTDIQLIADGGRIDDDRHEVVDVMESTDPGRHETIGGTVKLGFRLGGRVLRAQQVVMWRATAGPSARK